jgi:hypothetical protein
MKDLVSLNALALGLDQVGHELIVGLLVHQNLLFRCVDTGGIS